MKILLTLGAVLLGFCTIHPAARAVEDGPYYDDYQRPAPRYYEGRVAGPRCYLPPPRVCLPPPRVLYYSRPHHRRHCDPYSYGYGYGYAPGIHIGIGF